jgi:hypothetical protein
VISSFSRLAANARQVSAFRMTKRGHGASSGSSHAEETERLGKTTPTDRSAETHLMISRNRIAIHAAATLSMVAAALAAEVAAFRDRSCGG